MDSTTATQTKNAIKELLELPVAPESHNVSSLKIKVNAHVDWEKIEALSQKLMDRLEREWRRHWITVNEAQHAVGNNLSLPADYVEQVHRFTASCLPSRAIRDEFYSWGRG